MAQGNIKSVRQLSKEGTDIEKRIKSLCKKYYELYSKPLLNEEERAKMQRMATQLSELYQQARVYKAKIKKAS